MTAHQFLIIVTLSVLAWVIPISLGFAARILLP